MTSAPLPAFCSPFDTTWPAPLALAGAHLLRLQFDPAQWQAEDSARCGIASVPGVAKRQSEHLAGRLCAREALRLLGKPGTPGRDEDGAPLWPAGTLGSISHGAGQAAALVAHSADWQGLGLDLEKRLSVERARKLASEILTPAELQRASDLPDERFALLVTLTFSLKESLFKALYPLVRQRFYFHDAELLTWADDGSARLRLLIDLSPTWHAGRELGGQLALYDDRLLSLVAIPA